jgi:hypothetical protein
MNLFLTMFFLVVCIFYTIKQHQFEKTWMERREVVCTVIKSMARNESKVARRVE